MLMQRESVVLGLVVLISVSASHPHGSALQDTGKTDLSEMYHHHYPDA